MFSSSHNPMTFTNPFVFIFVLKTFILLFQQLFTGTLATFPFIFLIRSPSISRLLIFPLPSVGKGVYFSEYNIP
jgi:hypothetical protein